MLNNNVKYHEVRMNRRQAAKYTKSSRKFFKWLAANGFNIDYDAPDIEQVVQDGKCYVIFRQVKEVQID